VAIFPDTQHSIVAALQSADAATRNRALDIVLRVYRNPVITVLRARWHLDDADAEDLAHDFFLKALTNDWLARYDPTRARFRTFLRQCLQAFASTAHQAATRQKRGGHLHAVSLDDANDIPQEADAHDDLFEQEWIRSVFATALDAFRAECESIGRTSSYNVFTAIDVCAGCRTPVDSTHASHQLHQLESPPVSPSRTGDAPITDGR
jgi:RNA polymerase sigma factor (sigma-70 family)